MHTHYIAMSGMKGCLPDSCQHYDTAQDAVNAIADLFDLGRTRRARLSKFWYMELIPTFSEEPFGAEYCEIRECRCDTPEVHDDY